MKKINLLLLVILLSLRTLAQTSEDSVKGAIRQFFTGMFNADTLLLKKSFSETATLQTAVGEKAGGTGVENTPLQDFYNRIGRLSRGDADERIQFDVLKIDGPLAMAWTPYQFYFKGKINHCGVDAFLLVRIKGSWKIQSVIDTRRKEDCK